MPHLIRTLLCVAFLPLTAWADEPTWPDLMKAGRDAQTAGKYRQAREVLKQALAQSDKFDKADPRRTETRLELAGSLLELGEYGPCEKLCVESIAAVKAQHGDEHPQIERAERILTDIYLQLGMPGLAGEHCQRGLAISKALHGERDPATALFNVRMWHIGSEYGDGDTGNEAVELLQAAFGDSDRRLIVPLEARAKASGAHELAVPFAKRALEIARETCGEQHPIYGRCLSTLATALRLRGEFAEAELRTKQAIEVLFAALGPDSPQLAAAYRNLAWIEREHGQAAQADARYLDSIRLRYSGLSDAELCHFFDQFIGSTQYRQEWSFDDDQDPTAEVLLTEMTRRGGKVVEAFLEKTVAAWSEKYSEVFRDLRKREAARLLVVGQDELEEQRVLYSQNAEIVTALRRIQKMPDPLKISLAGQQELNCEFPGLPELKVRIRNVDSDRRKIGFQESGNYRSGRQERWRIEVADAAGSVRPFHELYHEGGFIFGGGLSRHVVLNPKDQWETELDMASYVDVLEPGEYQFRILYHNRLEISGRKFITGLIACRSKPFKLTINRRSIRVSPQRREEIQALLTQFKNVQQCKILEDEYGPDYHKFIAPESDYGRILTWGWTAVPVLIEDLDREGQTAERRAHLLALLFALTHKNDPRFGYGAIGDYTTWGLKDTGLWGFANAFGQPQGRLNFEFEFGQILHEVPLDAKAQEPFIKRWRDFAKHLDVTVEQ